MRVPGVWGFRLSRCAECPEIPAERFYGMSHEKRLASIGLPAGWWRTSCHAEKMWQNISCADQESNLHYLGEIGSGQALQQMLCRVRCRLKRRGSSLLGLPCKKVDWREAMGRLCNNLQFLVPAVFKHFLPVVPVPPCHPAVLKTSNINLYRTKSDCKKISSA